MKILPTLSLSLAASLGFGLVVYAVGSWTPVFEWVAPAVFVPEDRYFGEYVRHGEDGTGRRLTLKDRHAFVLETASCDRQIDSGTWELLGDVVVLHPERETEKRAKISCGYDMNLAIDPGEGEDYAGAWVGPSLPFKEMCGFGRR